MIVKIQVPLMSNTKNAPALIYNEDRSFEKLVQIDDALSKWMGGQDKAYFEVKQIRAKIKILKEVEAQGW